MERVVPALLVLVGPLLFGCGGPSRPEDKDPQQTSKQQVVRLLSRLDSLVYFNDRYVEANARFKANAFKPELGDSVSMYQKILGDLTRHVNSQTWTAARDTFRHRFDNYGSTPDRIWPKDSVEINVTSFISLIQKYRPARDVGNWQSDSLPGVLFYYGTDANNALALGVEFLGLKWEDASKKQLRYEDGTGHFFLIDPADATLKPTDRAAWTAAHWDNHYLLRVLVRKPDLKNYGGVDILRDAHAEAYWSPYFEHLCDSNNGGGGKFIVTSGCEPSADPKDYTPHRLMVHVVDAAKKRRLDDMVDVDKPLYNKALELGSPCPPGCKKVEAP